MTKKLFFIFLLVIAVIFLIVIRQYFKDEKNYQEFLINFEKINHKKSDIQAISIGLSSSTKAIEMPILTYHSVTDYPPAAYKIFTKFTVTPAIFEKQLEYLKENNYTVISFQALIDWFLENKPLPSKPVILTFDDGWKSQYLYALPILERYHYTATFFIYTNAIGHNHFMNWDEVKELSALGMTIGGHTKSHPYLIKLDNDQKLRDEIGGGKKITEDHLGKTVNIFAYPFGHYNERVIEIVKEAGYQAARTTYRGLYQTENDLFKLKGIEVTNNFNEFISLLNKKR